jgi:predicted DNA repair protein MutK
MFVCYNKAPESGRTKILFSSLNGDEKMLKPELRNELSLNRQAHYFDIMRTTLFCFVALAAIIELGPDRYSAPLTVLVITVVSYGVLAGNTALTDIGNLLADLDEETASSNYGKGIKARNVPALKMISSALIILVGVAELYAIFN